jgi:serine/threonine-protein kinase
MGTPGFMAPEQAMALELDGRADVYALGCVAYWLLSAEQVFDHAEITALLVATISEQPDLTRLPPSVPQAMVDIVRRCLAKAPEDRPSSARALAQELRALDFSRDPGWSDELAQQFWRQHLPPRERKAATPEESIESARTMLLDVSGVASVPEAEIQRRAG